MKRIATYGKPGVGKSTFTAMLTEELTKRGHAVVKIKLGTPLYDLQTLVYQVAGRPLLSPDRQDGPLLNSLGYHLRRINPTALTDTFIHRVEEAQREMPHALILCDDMRAPDVDALAHLDFAMVQIWAPDDLRRLRKAGRGDLAPGDDQHETEVEIKITPSYRVENTGSMEMLRARALELAEAVLP